MEILRTPDHCFNDLDGFNFAPHYTTVSDDSGASIRIHHIDEGPRNGPVLLLMHGNPTWCYLYRKMVGPLAEAGFRVIAMDLVGCGRSDKPAGKDDYTLQKLYDWTDQWLRKMGLDEVTLFCQDWGGTIGLYLVSQYPERFSRVIASNTGVPAGEGESEFFSMWVNMMRDAEEFPLDAMLPGGMTHALTATELAAYKAPFPDKRYMAGICKLPMLLAVQPDNPGVPLNKKVWEGLRRFDKPFLTLWGALDPVSPKGDRFLQKRIPGCEGQEHFVFANANHFIQEDVPGELVDRIIRFAGKAG